MLEKHAFPGPALFKGFLSCCFPCYWGDGLGWDERCLGERWSGMQKAFQSHQQGEAETSAAQLIDLRNQASTKVTGEVSYNNPLQPAHTAEMRLM